MEDLVDFVFVKELDLSLIILNEIVILTFIIKLIQNVLPDLFSNKEPFGCLKASVNVVRLLIKSYAIGSNRMIVQIHP